MGVDVTLCAENQEKLFPKDYYRFIYSDLKHALSRFFCHFMLRQETLESGEPELDQVGRITSVDIQPLYDMAKYREDTELEYYLPMIKNSELRQQVLDEAIQHREKLQGNIETVLFG